MNFFPDHPFDLNSKDLVQSVDRSLVLLETLCDAENGCSIKELAKATSLPKSTVHRLLKTLVHHNLVNQDAERGHYSPGLKLFELAQTKINRLSLRDQSQPFLAELAYRTKETIHLAILDGYEVVYIDKEDTSHPIRMHSAIGKRSPAHCTGLGKAMLAYLSDQELEEAYQLKGLPRHTPRTITNFSNLKTHLAAVKRQGYAIDNAEHEEDIYCVAASIRDHRGRVIAAISLSVPGVRHTLESLDAFIPLVCQYAELISRQMGFISNSCSQRSLSGDPKD
jgi:IclR family transcriptional regulator, KDG regulon repressor